MSMSIKRLIVDSGKKVSHFFANDLQNYYYRYYFIEDAKKYIGSKKYPHDKEFERCSKAYWKLHSGISINTIWHDYYSSCNGIRDVRYVPENIYYAYIEPFFNRKEFTNCCDDKCYYSERFPNNAISEGVNRPPTIIRNISGMYFDKDFQILSFEDAVSLLMSVNTGYVIKESITGTGGNRIVFVEPGERKTKEEISTVFKKYSKDFIVEGIISQCDELKSLNPTSVNTIRFITFMDGNGVHILSSVLRIGGTDSRTDNFSTGGIGCGIDNDGTIKREGYDQKYNKYVEFLPNGVKFAGKTIPSYGKAMHLVQNLHLRFGHFRIISWDIAIGEDYKPVIIEFNLTPQSIDLHQINNGPLFGEYTDEVLHEVFGK